MLSNYNYGMIVSYFMRRSHRQILEVARAQESGRCSRFSFDCVACLLRFLGLSIGLARAGARVNGLLFAEALRLHGCFAWLLLRFLVKFNVVVIVVVVEKCCPIMV